MDTDQEVEFQTPNSYSVSSNDLSLSSLEIAPKISHKYKTKQECRSDSSGCGMSSTRVSKENTLVSGINMKVDHNKRCSPLNYECEMIKLPSSTPVKSFEHNLCSKKNDNTTKVSNKQHDGSQKRHQKKYRRTVIFYYFDCLLILYYPLIYVLVV